MSSDAFELRKTQTLEEAFPEVDPNATPLGPRVLVQLRRVPRKTSGGLIIVEETKETVKWNGQVAKVIALGPLAFKNRESASPWPEGMWVEPGDYIRVPRWNGDRIEVPIKNKLRPSDRRARDDDDEEEPVTFVIFNDHEIIAKIPGDPLAVKTYIL